MIGKLGPLEWIFNTPSHHRVHHGKLYITIHNPVLYLTIINWFIKYQVATDTV